MSAAQRPALGISLIIAADACFSAMDSSTRFLGALMPLTLMLWARYGIHTLVMAAWLALGRGTRFRPTSLRFQLLRGALLLGSSTLSFLALQRLPVAEFTAIVMLTPLLVTLLAAWLLHERVSAMRWALVAGGFAGALIIIRPGSGLFGWAVLLPLAGALTNACFQVMTSKFGATESALTTNFYTGLTGTALLTPLLLASPIDARGQLAHAPPLQWAVLMAIGVLGTAGHLLLIKALSVARTSTLMPFLYVQIGFAALAGWLVFRAVPDAWGWLGMAVIAACGAASAWLNVRTAGRPVTAIEVDTMME